MLPTKRICQVSSPLSPPLSTLESLTWIKPSDCEQPIKSTFASVTLPALTTSEPYTSPHLVWVRVPEMESKAPQSVVQDLPFLEAESPATTGIEAPVVAQHLNAHTRMSAIAVGVGELTDDRSI